MKLIGSLTSPYVRKARVVLAEKKIEYEFVPDNPWNADSGVSRSASTSRAAGMWL